jgi:hypothetical protein
VLEEAPERSLLWPDEPEEGDQSRWAPGKGLSWSVGEPAADRPHTRPEPEARDEAQEDEGRLSEDRDFWQWPDEGPPPPAAGSADDPTPSEWDLRRDPPVLEAEPEVGEPGERRPGPSGPAGGEASVESSVRILGPDAALRPVAPPGEVGEEPPVRILGPEPEAESGAPPEVPPRSSPPPDSLRAIRWPPATGVQVGAPEAAREGSTRARVVKDGNGEVDAGGPPTALAPLPIMPTPAPPAPSATTAAPAAPAAAPMPTAAPAPAPAPTKARPKAQPLAVVPKITRPHGRLGFLWVGVTVATVVAGAPAAGAWLALCAAIAAMQTAKVWRDRSEKPIVVVAAGTAAALPLSAILGLRAMTAAVAVCVVVTLLARVFSITKAPSRDVALTLAIGIVIGLAVASVVLLRNINIQAPLLLLAFTAFYDAGAYLVGTGASSAWEGPAAGVFSLIPVTMLAAVTLVPPFTEGGPLVLGAVAALLAPCGPLAGSALLGERDAEASALRRLDSLLVLGPVWAWCAAAFLR